MVPPTAHVKQTRGLALDLLEHVEGHRGEGIVDGPAVAGAEHPPQGVLPLDRVPEEAFLRRQIVHGIADTSPVDGLATHLCDDVAQPAGMNPAAGSKYEKTFVKYFLSLV